MKKIFCILLMLTLVVPAVADPTPTPVSGTPTHADPATLAVDENSQTINPGYALVDSAVTDANAASAGYVKGAYNASIKAINTVASVKQDLLSSSNVTTSGSGAVVTGVSASGGTITVTKTNETTIPTGSSSGSNRANLWME